MKKSFVSLLVVFGFLFSFCPQAAEAQTSTSGTTNGIRRGVAIVMFAGLAGAVLGVSTLSFYGEPQEHINNIWTGLALGALAGGAYVVSQSQKATMKTEQQRPTNPYQVARVSRSLLQYEFSF